jgi:hypothetical protein
MEERLTKIKESLKDSIGSEKAQEITESIQAQIDEKVKQVSENKDKNIAYLKRKLCEQANRYGKHIQEEMSNKAQAYGEYVKEEVSKKADEYGKHVENITEQRMIEMAEKYGEYLKEYYTNKGEQYGKYVEEETSKKAQAYGDYIKEEMIKKGEEYKEYLTEELTKENEKFLQDAFVSYIESIKEDIHHEIRRNIQEQDERHDKEAVKVLEQLKALIGYNDKSHADKSNTKSISELKKRNFILSKKLEESEKAFSAAKENAKKEVSKIEKLALKRIKEAQNEIKKIKESLENDKELNDLPQRTRAELNLDKNTDEKERKRKIEEARKKLAKKNEKVTPDSISESQDKPSGSSFIDEIAKNLKIK